MVVHGWSSGTLTYLGIIVFFVMQFQTYYIQRYHIISTVVNLFYSFFRVFPPKSELRRQGITKQMEYNVQNMVNVVNLFTYKHLYSVHGKYHYFILHTQTHD